MKKSIKAIALAGLLSVSVNQATAGVGLGSGAIANLAQGRFLWAAAGGALTYLSVNHGINLIQSGRIGWGVFFIILQDNDLIGAEDVELLNSVEVSTKEAFLEIISNKEMSAEEKEELLSELF